MTEIILPILALAFVAFALCLFVMLKKLQTRMTVFETKKAEQKKKYDAETLQLNGEAEQLRAELALTRESLEKETDEKNKKAHLLGVIENLQLAQNGRSGIFVFDCADGECVCEMCGKSLVTTLTDDGRLELKDVLASAEESKELRVGGRIYSVFSSEAVGQRVYILTDITDSVRVSELARSEKLWRKKAEYGDTYTNAVSFAAFIELGAFVKGDGVASVMFIQTEAALGGFPSEDAHELYMKSAADALTELFENGIVARYSSDSFCCIAPRKDADAERQSAEAAIALLDGLHTVLRPDRKTSGPCNLIELAEYGEGDLERLVYAMSIKAIDDRNAGRLGARRFESADVDAIFARRAAAERIITEKQIRFSYRPIALASNARIFGYELVPYFTDELFSAPESVVENAEIFGLGAELEALIFSEGMRIYTKAVSDGKLMNTSQVWIRALGRAAMNAESERLFHERYYDSLKNLITEPNANSLDAVCVSAKLSCAARWGARSAIRLGADAKENLIKLLTLKPALVKISAEVICDPKAKAAVKELAFRQRKGEITIHADGIGTAGELEAAIAAGAAYLSGDFIGRAEGDFGEITDKAMNHIGNIQFGKRG